MNTITRRTAIAASPQALLGGFAGYLEKAARARYAAREHDPMLDD